MLTDKFKEIQDEMKNIANIYDAIEYANKSNPFPYPERIGKPFLCKNPTSNDAVEYATKLKHYEDSLVSYKESKMLYDQGKREIIHLIEERIKDEAGLDIVPEQYRDKVYYHAYSSGHSYGYSEVYNHLCTLIDIFE